VQDGSQNNTVLSTSPSAGQTMDPDDEITVVVGRASGNGSGGFLGNN